MNQPEYKIHPTAIVDAGANLHPTVKVGPYSCIGDQVEIGADTVLHNHVTITGPTYIGERCQIFPYASLGQPPQQKGPVRHEHTTLVVGNDNIIREFTTFNRGTEQDIGTTIIGDRGYFMTDSHIAHDCVIGDDVIFANGVILAGHVVVGKGVLFGGYSGSIPHCKIGDYVFVGAKAKIAQDVPPYMIVDTKSNLKTFGVNQVALSRQNFSQAEIQEVKIAYRLFFQQKCSRNEAIEQITQQLPNSKLAKNFIAFLQHSKRCLRN